MKTNKFGEMVASYIFSLPTAVALAANLFGAFLISKKQSGNLGELLLFAAIFLLVFNLCFYNRFTSIATGGLALLALAAFAVMAFIRSEILEFISFSMLTQYLFYVIIFLSSIAVYFSSKSFLGVLLLFVGGTGALFYMSYQRFTLSQGFYYLFLVSVVALLIIRAILKRASTRSVREMRHITELAICTAVLTLMVSLFIYNVVESFKNNHSGLYEGNQYIDTNVQGDYANTGFEGLEGNGHLGIPLKMSKDIVFTVKSSDSFYLKGSTYDTYNDSSWDLVTKDSGAANSINDFSEYFWMSAFDYVNDRNYFVNSDPLDIKGYLSYYQREKESIPLKTLTVTYMSGNVKNLFLPLNILSFKPNASSKLSMPATEVYTLNSAVSLGSSYTVVYPKIDPAAPKIKNILVNDVTVFNEILKYWRGLDPSSRIAFKGLEGSKDLAAEKIGSYTQAADYIGSYDSKISAENLLIGASVTQRTKELAVTLTQNCKNDYEKVKEIQKYIAKNYTYTLNPPQPPEGEDLVDYFLFQSKKGYCVHFASAMAVLLRASGVPSRYVGGFISPSKQTNGIYNVTNSQAHSWVEVYSHSLGFYNVEATLGVSGTTDIEGNNQNVVSKSDLTHGNAKEPQGINDIVLIALICILIGIAALTCLALLIKRICRAVWLRRLSQLDPNTRTIQLYEYYISIFDRFGLRQDASVTPFEFVQNLKGDAEFHKGFNQATEIYVHAGYGGAAISEEDARIMSKFYKPILKHMRLYAGTTRYLAKRAWL